MPIYGSSKSTSCRGKKIFVRGDQLFDPLSDIERFSACSDLFDPLTVKNGSNSFHAESALVQKNTLIHFKFHSLGSSFDDIPAFGFLKWIKLMFFVTLCDHRFCSKIPADGPL